jgi:hypothetical protein
MGKRIIAGATLAAAAFGGFDPAARAQDIPAAMRGTWAEEASFCTTPTSDGRIAVSTRRVDFFASSCAMKGLRKLAGNAVRLAVTCEESGEKEDGTIELRALAGGKLRLKTDNDAPQTLLRCAGDPPVR